MTTIRQAPAWFRAQRSGGSPDAARLRRTEKKRRSNMSDAPFTLLQTLAQHVLAFDKRQLTKGSIAAARTCILDTIGVTLAGHLEPCTQILLKIPGVATAP